MIIHPLPTSWKYQDLYNFDFNVKDNYSFSLFDLFLFLQSIIAIEDHQHCYKRHNHASLESHLKARKAGDPPKVGVQGLSADDNPVGDLRLVALVSLRHHPGQRHQDDEGGAR